MSGVDNLEARSNADSFGGGGFMRPQRGFWRAAAVGLCIVFCTSSAVFAQTEGPSGVTGSGDPAAPTPEETLETPRGLGMGTGARAGAVGVSALAYNPANLSLGSAYHIEALSSVIPGNDTTWTIGSAVVDSSTSRLALGTSFRGTFGGEDREYRGWDWRTAAGISIVKQFGVGLGVRWARIDPRRRTVESVNGESRQRLGPSLRAITMDAAVRITPIPQITIAGLGYNLIRTDSPLAPQMAGGSVNIAPIESLSFGGDLLVDMSTFDDPKVLGGGGLEYFAAGQVPLRAGYRRDQGRGLDQITASVGFVRRKFAIETALRQGVGSSSETFLLFMVRYVVR